MNRVAVAVVVLVLWSAAMFGAGWAWRGDRAEGTEARQRANTSAAQVQQINQARGTEHQQADTMAAIGAKHEEDRAAAPAVADAVVAGVRDGSLQLRNDLATCRTDVLSQTVAGTIERDANAQLRAEVAADLVRIGRDADDQVRGLQAVIAADRAEVMP